MSKETYEEWYKSSPCVQVVDQMIASRDKTIEAQAKEIERLKEYLSQIGELGNYRERAERIKKAVKGVLL